MERTGSYWKPLYDLLEGVVAEVLVVDAAHSKQVPGRSCAALAHLVQQTRRTANSDSQEPRP